MGVSRRGLAGASSWRSSSARPVADAPIFSRRSFLTGSALAVAGGVTWAPGAASAILDEQPRHLLGLYKSTEIFASNEGPRPKTATLNEIHQWAQMPLNWLGLMVEYHDVSHGLPAETAMRRYCGVVTWFETDDMDDALAYARWLGAQVRAGRRVVILGVLGALRDRRTGALVSPAALAETLAPLGLEFRGRPTKDPRLIALKWKDPRMVEFERKLPPGLPGYTHVVSHRPDTRVHLALERRDVPGSESHLVITGPWGGYAGAPYLGFLGTVPVASYTGSAQKQVVDTAPAPGRVHGAQWLLNPFTFFETALGIADWPRPDVTTLNGRRIVYCHIDGDGIRNESEVRRGALSGEVILEQILARFPLPTTVSVVVADVEPRLLGSARTQALARALFAMPHVEAASHTYFHPLDWETQTRSFDLPGHPYSLETETRGSIRYIDEHLLPAGKRVRVFQWSGSTNVPEDALAIIEGLGVANINGGDPMFDGQWPSYGRVAPLMRQVGRHWQIYTSAANENLYTNLWTGSFYGFRRVIETFRNTGAPRRVSPINIYYHFYSGERVASLGALQTIYEWVTAQRPAPVFASEYLAMVTGFRTARIARTGQGWRVWDHGELRTVRFDGAGVDVDVTRSRGVLGSCRHGGSLYVHLEGPGEALIVLNPRPPDVPRLVSASHRVVGFARAGGTVTLRLTGVGAKSVEVGGLPADGEVNVAVADAAGSRRLLARVNRDGVVTVEAGSGDPVTVSLT